MKIGVYTNVDRELSRATACDVADILRSFGVLEKVYEDGKDRDLGLIDFTCDVLIAIGGDGSMLKAVSYAARRNIPIFGINTGKIGFLTEVGRDNLKLNLNKVIGGEYFIEERAMLKAKDIGGEYYALNEAVIACNSCHVAEIEVKINDTVSDNIRADGVLVCTPTGSTAYSLSCNGPVLSPDVNAFVINAICPHSLHSCPMVVGSDSVVKLSCKDSDIKLIVDGRNISYPDTPYTIEIAKSEFNAKFIRLDKQNFYNRLLQKLSYWSV
ncbi:MAG: NAD(+)/NADH kinase [Clostridia bacterium]|nr:NAD(+)/NADH kinase [Clostridia bacterium]